MHAETFRLIACPTLSHETRTDTYVHAGASVGDALRGLGWTTDGLSARVFIDGQLIPDAEWEQATPKAGQAVVVRRVMSGGGGGNTGKQIGMLVGMIALMAASFFVPGAIAGAASFLGASGGVWGGIVGSSWAIQAGALVAGSLALHGPIPRPLPRRLEAPR
jgi:sulfur carrier protein ThiS